MSRALEKVATERGLQLNQNWLNKCIQLYETYLVRGFGMLTSLSHCPVALLLLKAAFPMHPAAVLCPSTAAKANVQLQDAYMAMIHYVSL